MSNTPDPKSDQTAAFSKLWSDSCARLMQAAMSYSPETTPPELLRQIRGGMMEALSKSWEEFLRSPQFLEGMRQMMDQAVAFRKFSADFLTKTRHATEGVAHDDIESLRAALGQMESRLARQLDVISTQTNQLARGLEQLNQSLHRPGVTPPVSAPEPKPPATATAAKGKSNKRKSQS